MARDADVPTIFNPKRVRAPSVIITSEEVVESDRIGCDVDRDREQPSVPPTPLSPRAPLTPQVSICSAPPLTTQPSLQQAYSESAASSQDEERQLRDKKSRSCCSRFAKKIYYGICVTVTLTASWVTSTHCIKHLYLEEYPSNNYILAYSTETTAVVYTNASSKMNAHLLYRAPFFTAWFCTNWLILFYPFYILVMLIHNKCKSANAIMFDAFSDFKEKGFTFARFLSRCGLFCLLWVLMIYMYTYSLKILLSTDVVTLFATNVSCIYLLSWVILHEQFVGVRIVAAILCDTGIALLAYMDGITGSSTLGGVVLAACAAAGFAIFKVLFRKVMGEVNCGQRALFFSILGVVNASLLWPLCLALYLTGSETLPYQRMPWVYLLVASISLFIFHLVFQFGHVITYNIFVSLALITSVPVSAALDVVLYGVNFEGMKLSGVILIVVGFFLVMFPDNWPDYIMRLLRGNVRSTEFTFAHWSCRERPSCGSCRVGLPYSWYLVLHPLSLCIVCYYGGNVRSTEFTFAHWSCRERPSCGSCRVGLPYSWYLVLHPLSLCIVCYYGWSRQRQRGSSGSGRNRDAMDYRTGYIRSHLRSPSGRVR